MPLSVSVIPCSETERPLPTASSRSCTLWAAEPVKCWSRLPNASGATIRRSTEIPLWVWALTPFGPAVPAEAISGCDARCSASAAGSSAVAIRSMSLQVSAQRRAEPATSTRWAPGWSRSAAASSSATGRTAESRTRPVPSPGSPRRSIAASTFSSTFAPSPFRSRIRWASAASFSSSRVVIPSSSKRRRAVLAPRPGTRVTSISDGGNFAFSFSAAGISPVSTRASIFSARVLPTPGISVALPAAASSATETGLSRIAFAAVL